jgi:ParB/RepB/Spo0J family partition protein
MPTATLEKEINRLRDLKNGARDMFTLDPRIILISEGENPRDYTLAENRAHLDRLKASIKVHGVQQPLWVRYDIAGKCAILIDGECRLRAVLELIEEGVEIVGVPVIQKAEGDEASRLVMALTANTGKPLSKWEDGAAFRKLHNFGFEACQIAEKTGHDERYIREAMELAEAPQEVRQMLSEGSVSPGVVLQTLRSKGNAAGTEHLKQKVAEAAASQAPGSKKPARVKRARIATGVKFSDDDAVTLRDSLSWSLDLIGKNLTPEIAVKFNRAVDALKLFPEGLTASPKPDADDQPTLFPGETGEPDTVVVDGTKPAAPAAKKAAKKSAKKAAKK